MFKTIVEVLLEKIGSGVQEQNESNAISCPDCQTYEASLQKLEN
jgi:hypothetical protein